MDPKGVKICSWVPPKILDSAMVCSLPRTVIYKQVYSISMVLKFHEGDD